MTFVGTLSFFNISSVSSPNEPSGRNEVTSFADVCVVFANVSY